MVYVHVHTVKLTAKARCYIIRNPIPKGRLALNIIFKN